MPHSIERRKFLQRTGMLIAAMHAGGLATSSAATKAANGSKPVEFLRLRLRTNQPAALRDYYRKVLELPTTMQGDALSVRAGSTELLFVPDAAQAGAFYHVAFNIPENKLDRAIDWMKGRAELIPQPNTGRIIFDYPNWNANSIYWYDPAGNILEFIARHNLKNARSGGFGTSDVLHASEMGMVVPDVAAAIGELKQKTGIADYIGVGTAFAPIGNEHGLFIVVRSDRKWFNRIPPGIFPAEVKMRGGTPGQYSIPSGSMTIEVVA